jgi:hypothetical protein
VIEMLMWSKNCDKFPCDQRSIFMAYPLSIVLSALTVLIGISGNAFAGATPIAVPEPATLTLLAIGFGGAAAVKYFKRK